MLSAADANTLSHNATFTISDEEKVNEALTIIELAVTKSASKGLFGATVYLNRAAFSECIYDIIRILEDNKYIVDINADSDSMYRMMLRWSHIWR